MVEHTVWGGKVAGSIPVSQTILKHPIIYSIMKKPHTLLICFIIAAVILFTAAINQSVQILGLSMPRIVGQTQTSAPLMTSGPLQSAGPLQTTPPNNIQWLNTSLRLPDNLEVDTNLYDFLIMLNDNDLSTQLVIEKNTRILSSQSDGSIHNIEFSYTPQLLEAAVNKIISNRGVPALALLPPVVYNPSPQNQASPR